MSFSRGTISVPRVLGLVGSNSGVAAACRKRLWQRAEVRHEPVSKTGRLHARSLVRSVAGSRLTGTLDPRIKERKVQGVSYDVYVTLLVDMSGSMGGRKLEPACAAALILLKALDPLGCHVRVSLFSESRHHGPLHYVVKDFKQKRSIDKVAAAMAKAVPMLLMQNADGESILHEYAALRAASEGADKRFMFVMSDGSPCSDGNALEQYDLTKMAVKSIEQDPHTVIAGLGILDNNVEMFYSNNVVVDDVSNLSPALIQLVEGTIVRNV